MSLNVATIDEGETVRRAANLMRGRSIGCLVATRNGRMAGIVTVSDLLDLLGKGGERRVANPRASLHYRVPHQKQHRGRSWWRLEGNVARKQLLVRSEAREKILHGCLALADAVRVTLGPKSKCVLIEKKWGRPIVCNDGVTIAKEFELKDPEENLGVQVMRQAAERTGEDVGDGTTTSTLLATAISPTGSGTLPPVRAPST